MYQRMDLNAMEMKVQASRYRCLEEFYADAQTIHHNCVLVYGSEITFLGDCVHAVHAELKYS